MIQGQNLQKQFGHFNAVKDLSFTVQAGEVLGFLGPNGAGKTTTMRMITGFLRPDGGRVRIFDHDIQSQPLAAKAMLGYLPEGAPAYGDMTVRTFLDFIARMRGFQRAEKKRRIERVIGLLELAGVAHRPIEQLSKGFKRRVGLAQAIIHQPPALILDEPTDGLDPNQKHQVRQLIRSLAENSLVIVSTHILEEVTAVCSRALIIARGQMVFDGTPTELMRRSRYHGAVTVVFKRPPAQTDLHSLPGVARVEPDARQPERVTLLPEPGALLYASVQSWLLENPAEVVEVSVEPGRLDEVFRRLTIEETPTTSSD